MRIAVNTRFLLQSKLEGFGWYTYETLSRITRQHPEHEFIFLFDRAFDPKFVFADNVTPVVIGPQARHPILFYLWFERSVKRALKKHRADVFVSPDGYLSLGSQLPQLAVIHDLSFEHYPEDIPKTPRKYLKKFFPKFAAKADQIVTVSNYSKQDLIEQYQVNPAKIDVVHNGAAEFFSPLVDAEKTAVKTKWTGGENYFVYVGALHPRKNIGRLLKAFDQFKSETGSQMKLVIVGEKLWTSSAMTQTFDGIGKKDEVIFTGHVQPDELNRLVGAAHCMTYVSYFEGFGLPVAEAFRCHIPVITSNCTSLPEVAGDAALLVDPFSVDEIAGAMQKVANDVALHQGLTEKAKQRANTFTWQAAADGLWRNIEKLF